jgi:hypothetical protein
MSSSYTYFGTKYPVFERTVHTDYVNKVENILKFLS